MTGAETVREGDTEPVVRGSGAGALNSVPRGRAPPAPGVGDAVRVGAAVVGRGCEFQPWGNTEPVVCCVEDVGLNSLPSGLSAGPGALVRVLDVLGDWVWMFDGKDERTGGGAVRSTPGNNMPNGRAES